MSQSLQRVENKGVDKVHRGGKVQLINTNVRAGLGCAAIHASSKGDEWHHAVISPLTYYS
eukprot:314603-Amphidinium_carterae.1